MTGNLFRIIQIIYLFLKYDVDKMLVDSDIVSSKKYFYLFPLSINQMCFHIQEFLNMSL